MASASVASPMCSCRARVELREELGDPGVEGGEGEEGLVPETSEDPPLHDLDCDLNFRFIPWLRRARGQDDGAVVLREGVVCPLHARLVAAGHHDTAL